MFDTASAISSWNKLQQNIELTEAETKSFNAAMKSSVFDDYIDSIKDGSASIGGYIKYLFTARQETLALSVAQKTATVVAKAFKTALNVAVVMLVSEGIEKLIEYFSNLKTASEQAKEELNTATQNLSDTTSNISNINTKLEDTDKQIESLKAKGSLTFVEQAQLTTLQKTSSELKTQLEIQQALQKVQNEKKTQAAVKSINAQDSEKINPYNGSVNTDNNIDAKSGMEGVNEALSFYTAREEQLKKDQEEYNQLVAQGNKADKEKKATLEAILKDDDSTTIKTNLLNRAKAYQEEADAIDVESVTDKKSAQSAKESALEKTNAILKVVDAENYAKDQTDKFNSVWKNNQFKSTVNDLNNLSKQGKLTAQTLNGSQYSGFVKAMENAGLSVKDVVEQINALNNTNNSSTSNLSTITTSLSSFDSTITSIGTDITNLGKSFKDLDDAITSVTEGQNLSGEQIVTLLGEYPELANAIQTTSGGYTIELSTLEALRKEKIQAQVDSIQAEITTAKQTLASTQSRLQAYKTEIQGISSVAEAKAKLAEISNTNTISGFLGNLFGTTTKAKEGLQTYIDYHNAESTVAQDESKLNALQTELTVVTQPNYTKAVNSTTAVEKENTATKKAATEASNAHKKALESEKTALEKQKDALDQEKKALQSTYDQMQTDQENIKSLLSLVEEMLKQQYSDQKDAYSKLSQQAEDLADKEKTALETQLSALKDKIDLQKKALDQQKEERSHAEDLADKEKDIATLRTKLAIQQQDTSDASKAKQIQYQKQIADKTKELNDFQYDYSVTTQQNALDALQDKYDKEYKAKEDELDKKTTAQKNYYQGLIDQIDQYTAKEVNIRTEAMNLINGRSQDLLNRLLEYNRIYGETMKCPSPLVQ